MAAEAKLVITAEANTQKAQQDLNKLKASGITAADEIAKANRRAARHPLRILAPWALAVGGMMKGLRALVNGFKELVRRGKQLEETAKNLSLSVETYSALEAHAKRAGVTTEQFNAAMARLKDGKATLDEISKGFGDIADKAKMAGDITNDVLARQMKRVSDVVGGWWDRFKRGVVDFFTTNWQSRLELFGYPAIDASIEAGESFDEAMRRANKEVGMVGGVIDDNLAAYWASRVQVRMDEQVRSEKRLAASYMKDIGDEGRAREAWQKYTGKTISEEEFRAFVEQGKTPGDKYSDILSEFKKAPVEEKEEEEKKADTGGGLQQGFTAGGGALAGLTYAFMGDCQGSYIYEQVKVLKSIEKQGGRSIDCLGEINATLKGE